MKMVSDENSNSSGKQGKWQQQQYVRKIVITMVCDENSNSVGKFNDLQC